MGVCILEPSDEVVLGQLIKIKSVHLPYIPFMREKGVVIGFGQNAIIIVRPISDPSRTLNLYPHEVRDTNPCQMALP